MAIGITDIDLYVPRFAMDGSHHQSGLGVRGKFTRSVACYDEDPITMTVEACESLIERSRPEAIWWASVSAPYLEKSNASLIAAALDLPNGIRGCELGGTLRAGTQGVLAAWEAIRAGSIANALVAASDLRLAKPGSPEEGKTGDAAIALTISEENPIAEILAIHTHTREFLDRWRRDTDRYVLRGEAKFVTDYGLIPDMRRALEAILQKAELQLDQIAKVAVNAPDGRARLALGKALGLGDRLIESPPRDLLGETGTADGLIELAAALESAQPGEKILLLNYAEGADAILLGVTDAIDSRRPKIGGRLDSSNRKPLPSYGHYLKFRNLIDQEEVSPFASLPLSHRQEKQILRLTGTRCLECETIHYPSRRICSKCRAKDKMADHRLNKSGAVFTFTVDHLFPSPLSPISMAAVDLDGGGRFFAQLTDLDPATEAIAIGDRVRLSFRRYHEGEEFHNYFWKFVALRDSA